MSERREWIPEVYRRLGRYIHHDERSRRYVAEQAAAIQTVMHARHCAAYDQGNVGMCTGTAETGMLMTDPFWVPGRAMTEADALRLYSEATRIDRYWGTYPPDDTGSSGLAVMKAAKREGLVQSYSHTFSLTQLLGALTLRPGILGVTWYESFDTPLPTGECHLPAGAEARGGHEVELFGLDVEHERVWCYNSWGPWGAFKDGRFWFSFPVLARLLSEHGDATFAAV